MRLPRYEAEFNNGAEFGELTDSSFDWNARTLLEGYYRFLPSLREHQALYDSLKTEDLRKYNEQVAQVLYGPKILELFKNHQYQEITDLSERIKQRQIQPKREILELINFNSLGMVVVRPEARFLGDNVNTFLVERGYEIVLEQPMIIDLRQYWTMYNEGFLQSNIDDFPTRTLIYTHGESKVLVLHREEYDAQNNLAADLKGQAGIPSAQPTLRGTVVLDGFEKAKHENESLFYESVDPLGMYRAICTGKIHSSDPYDQCADPVLYYAGQGVHIPDDHELSTNAGVLLNTSQLETLSYRFRKT